MCQLWVGPEADAGQVRRSVAATHIMGPRDRLERIVRLTEAGSGGRRPSRPPCARGRVARDQGSTPALVVLAATSERFAGGDRGHVAAFRADREDECGRCYRGVEAGQWGQGSILCRAPGVRAEKCWLAPMGELAADCYQDTCALAPRSSGRCGAGPSRPRVRARAFSP
jgi:hypothetical protein